MKIITQHFTYKLIIVCLLAYLLVDVNTPVPGTAKSGELIQPPEQWGGSDRNSFVVATYNIRRSKGLDGQRDINRAVDVLHEAHADIIGLNELSGTLFYGLTDQAAQVASALGFGWLFAPTYSLLFQNYFGNGLVSRWPTTAWQTHPLINGESEKQSFRNMIVAAIPVNGVTLNVIVTHLDRSAVRSEQLRQVLERFLSLPEPAILLGDLNTRASDPLLAQYIRRPDVADAIADALHHSEGKIDWIISRGLQIKGGGTEARGVSDHPAYWVEFELPEVSPARRIGPRLTDFPDEFNGGRAWLQPPDGSGGTKSFQ